MTTNNFPAFAKLVAADFQAMTTRSKDAFVVNVDGDALFAEYLKVFPPGTDPVFKTKTEHDCACCRQFIRRAGNVAAVDASGTLRTVWDTAAEKAPRPYGDVAAHLRDLVRAAYISDIYRVEKKETSFGAEKTLSLDVDSQSALTWNHFYTGPVPEPLRVASPGADRGAYRTTVEVFERGLTEIAPDAVDVLSLILDDGIYRGEEHKGSVLQFKAAQTAFRAMESDWARNIFVWTNAHGPAARFRNTVIGTLVVDLSEGRDVEAAVRSFEQKVAPTNYKRTSAVITPGMVKKAMETIEALGLEPALERRFAVIGDVSVRDVLWVDGGVRPAMKGGIGEALMQHAATKSAKSAEDDEKRAEEVTLDNFVKTVLPQATGVEIFFRGAHLGNLVSLTAPVHPEPQRLFRWGGNDFAWSYNGDVTDSIAERVKKAGGKVEGAVLRVSLSWFNYDDLDLHILEPQGRSVGGLRGHIYFANKRGWTGGELDVDMNAGGPRSREAVENVVWMKTVPNGDYKIVVNNYSQREMSGVGFVVEVEYAGKISHFLYNKAVRQSQNVDVASLHVQNGAVERVELGDPAIAASNVFQEKWGLTSETYAKVNVVTLSPNYWGDNAVGNKHVFFFLDGAKNDEPTRGIYNEFLHPRLEPHRKVFEVIGEKTKCQPTDGQLSGLGFSSTKKDDFVVRVRQGKKQRLYNVKVGAQ